MTIGVRGTSPKSFIVVTFSFLGTGIILKFGIEEVGKDRLNINVTLL